MMPRENKPLCPLLISANTGRFKPLDSLMAGPRHDFHPNYYMAPRSLHPPTQHHHTHVTLVSAAASRLRACGSSHVASHQPAKRPTSTPYIGHGCSANELWGCSNAPTVNNFSSIIDAPFCTVDAPATRLCSIAAPVMLRRLDGALLQLR